MKLEEILRQKGFDVYTITPDATVEDVVDALVEHNCGSLVVCDLDDNERMVGIITERDILRVTAAKTKPLAETKVLEAMSTDVVTGSLGDSVASVMGLLTEKRIRHLPILLEDGRLAGMISIGDVVKAQFDELAMENHYLKSYIQG